MAHFCFQTNRRDRADSTQIEPGLTLWVKLAGLVMMVGGACSFVSADELKLENPTSNRFSPEAIDFFEARVRPILVDHCIKCHGPKKQSSNLRLDSREAALKGGDSGPALVPAKPEESLLIQAVAQTHEELKMPPDGKLPEASVAIIRQWVALGAPWSAITSKGAASTRTAEGHDPRAPHWSFQPLVSPSLPHGQGSKLGGNARRRVHFGPARGRRDDAIGRGPTSGRLIRRATIDLWGIPPTADGN